MEYGPCALGNRSILADPARPEMRERVNIAMKRSEATVEKNGTLRPFASACAIEEAHRWFDIAPGAEFPYKTSTVTVRPEMRSLLPAITHVDGSTRLQTVTVEGNSDFHALLVAIGETTGRQMALNTSFDAKGQPIVNAPEEAIEAFLNSGIEDLFLENFHVRRNDA
jgi:carbamoyltransferase